MEVETTEYESVEETTTAYECDLGDDCPWLGPHGEEEIVSMNVYWGPDPSPETFMGTADVCLNCFALPDHPTLDDLRDPHGDRPYECPVCGAEDFGEDQSIDQVGLDTGEDDDGTKDDGLRTVTLGLGIVLGGIGAGLFGVGSPAMAVVAGGGMMFMGALVAGLDTRSFWP